MAFAPALVLPGSLSFEIAGVVEGVVVLSNLGRLAAGAPRPLGLADLGEAIGAPPFLLERVSARRQALPRQFVRPIAALLGVDPAEVEWAAGEVLDLGATLGFRAMTALPPDRCLGDALFPIPLRATVAPVFPGA